MPARRLKVPALISIVYDLGRQQAGLDLDDAGRRDIGISDVTAELDSWRQSGAEAGDDGVVVAVDRFTGLGRRTRAKVAQAFVDGYNSI